MNSTNYELACHILSVAYGQHTRHQFTLCLGCLQRCLNSFCVWTRAQDILCQDLPIYSVVSNKRSCQCCVHGLSIADRVYGNAVGITNLGPCKEQVGHYVYTASLNLVQYTSNAICQQALPANAASLSLLADCILSCIYKFMFTACSSYIIQ